jgi:MFS family permease
VGRKDSVYTPTFYLSILFNFLIGMNFTNSAVLPLYVNELGGSAATVGLFMGTAAVAAVVVRPLIGTVLDRFGTKLVLVTGALLISLPPLGYWALLDAGELTTWVYVLRVFHGFGFGAHFSAFFSLAASTSPPERRNESIAMYGISGLAAQLIGPHLGETILGSHGLPGFFLFITVFGLLGVLTALFIQPPKPKHSGNNSSSIMTSTIKLLAYRPMFLPFALALLLSVCFSSSQFFLGPLARDRGIEDFGLFFSGYAVAGITVRLISRKWGDRFGVRRVMIPAFLFYAAGMITIVFAQSTSIVILGGIFCGMSHGIVFPAVNSLGYNAAPSEYAGSAVALMTGMFDLGSILTAFLFGAIAELTDYGSVFILASVAGILAAGLAVASIIRRPELIQTRHL